MSRDPVSWLMVEPGWTVVDAHGKKVGKVDEVLGDEQIDIFHGLVVSGETVLSDQVAEIHEGEVRLVR
jgi:rRNA processing protein Gar1